MAAELGKAYVQIIPSAEGISGKIQSALGSEASSAGKSAGQSIGKQIGSFATKTVAALGVGKMIGDSLSKGMNFETSMAKASTLFTGTSGDLAVLEKQILRISSSTGVAAADLAEAAYSAESASVPMGNLGSMIESSAKLATAGFTDVDTALSATAKTMNAYGMMSDNMWETHSNMEKVQRVLIQTQNKGITTVGELGAALANVTPTAAAANVSFEQVGAALALMTAQGTPTAQATTQLRSAIAELQKEGTQASKALQEAAKGTEYAGMSFTEMMDNGADLGDVMGMLQDYADETGVSMLDLWSSIEGGNAALAIAKDVETFDEDLSAMATEADVVGEAYGKMSDTVSFKLEQLKTTLANMGIKAFSAVADDLSAGLETISGVFAELQGPLGELGGAFMEAGGAAVDAIADFLDVEEGSSTVETAVNVLKEVIGGLTDGLKFLADNMNIVAPVAAALAGGLLLLNSPIPKIVSGISGLAGKLSSIGGAATKAVGPVSNAGSSFSTMAGQALKMLAAAAALLLAAVAIQLLVDAAIEIADAGTGAQIALAAIAGGIILLMGAAALFGPALDAAAIGIAAFGASVLMIGAGVGIATAGIALLVTAVTGLVETVSANSEQLISIVQAAGDTISQILETVATGVSVIVTSIGDAVSGVVTAISDGISGVIDSIGDAISGVLDSLAGIIDSIGNAALNAGTGFSMLADAVIRLTQQTGVMDLAATLGTVATKIKDINSAADGSDNAANKIETIGTALKELPSAASTASSAFAQLTNAATQGCNNILSAFQSMDIAGAMNTLMANAYNTTYNWISQLKALFSSTSFSFNQSLALPHFSMSGTFNAETGAVPSVSVSWYKKAAEYGALFSQPTIIGVGDAADPELLLGESKLKEMLGNNGNNVTFNVSVNGAESPEVWATRFVREAKQYMRIS